MNSYVHEKLTTDADLSEASLEYAIERLNKLFSTTEQKLVIVCQDDTFIAGNLSAMFPEYSFIVCPTMKKDSWQVVHDIFSVYSNGA